MATVKAQLNSLRMAPRKVRAVTDLVKGQNAERALERLEFLVRRSSEPVSKLIKSALANAENNFSMVRSNLYIKEFYVDEGVKLKRFRAAGFGRPREIQKKTSHIHLVLAERVPGLKSEKRQTKEKEHVHAHEHNHVHEAKPKTEKPEIKTGLGKKTTGQPKGLKRIFQRKQV